jgi:hypothetical protein
MNHRSNEVPHVEAAECAKDKALRRQPFLGGPVVEEAQKYYCRADPDTSRVPKVQASRR